MKYMNCSEVLPERLIEEIRQYVEGVYIYIPVNEDKRYVRKKTDHQKGLAYRNGRIFDGWLRGMGYAKIAEVYCLSEKSIRRIVLAKRKEMEAVRIMIEEVLLKQWGIEAELRQINHSSWQVGKEYIIKVYDGLPGIKRNAEMFNILFDAGLPVPEIVRTMDQDDYATFEDRYYLLTKKLKGRGITDISGLDDEWFYGFGQIIAKLHTGFSQCEKTMSFWSNSMLEEMESWVRENLMKFDPPYLNSEDIEATIAALSLIYKDLPKQLIHRDVHLGNFLFEDGGFSGYVDFDLSQSNIRIFDVCYFLLGLLCKESGTKSYNQRWLKWVEEVVAGYDSMMMLSEAERNAIVCVMENIELLFVAYFLGEGDDVLARDAASIYKYIKNNRKKINNVLWQNQ